MVNHQSSTHQNIAPNEFRQLVKVAKLYYQFDLTQNEIAKRLGLSRVKIHRLLNTAKEIGIVKIQIDVPDSGFLDLENLLISKFGLRDALVVPAQENQQDLYLALGTGAAEWLIPKLKTDLRIGLGLGRTISHLPKVFEPHQQVDCIFTEIVGGASNHSGSFNSYNITSKMADLTGGRAEFFYAPTFVSNLKLKADLLKESSIQKALENAKKCDIVVQSVGPVNKTALLYQHEFISEKVLETLKMAGAVGDALGHYFDSKGNSISDMVGAHIMGLDLEDLKAVPWSVCVAGGEEKVEAIRAALKGAIFNVLVTDSHSAEMLAAKEARS